MGLFFDRGLGLDSIMIKLLEIYSDPGSLVLVLNTTSSEESYFTEELEMTDAAKQRLPLVVTNEFSSKEREELYLSGGVLFITSRILVVDILRNQIPTHIITGIIVNHAHKVTDGSTEAFILRLYRERNKTGFIKALSNSPQMFVGGFCQVERIMKNLFVRKLYLWPRFHVTVCASLDKHKPDVVELHQKMSPSMVMMQSAILDVMSACLQELKKANKSLEADLLTVETGISKAFDQMIRIQLEPMWHQLSSQTKQLISDLKTLRSLLSFLTQYDCVTFYKYLESIRSSSDKTLNKHSAWMFLDATDNLFACAQARVFGDGQKKGAKRPKLEISEPMLEENSKWKLLSDILDEIQQDTLASDQSKVLVVASDDRTCNQLREYLTNGGKSLLGRLYVETFGAKEKESTTATGGGRGKVKQKSAKQSTRGQRKSAASSSTSNDKTADEDSRSSLMTVSPAVLLVPLKGGSDPYLLTRALNDHEPRYIVFYDPDMEFVRQVEVYKAKRPGVPVRVYFLFYENSVEEQKYLTTLRKEKDAFELLIKEKASMVIPEDQDGKSGNAVNLIRDLSAPAASAMVSSRKAGGREESTKSSVVVDVREFRSKLPSIIHRRGMEVEPVTLEVGDYVLSPELCIERKSVSDLVSSLSSGRLYNQCVALTRYYRRPTLLIEFDEARSFSLQSRSAVGSEISSVSVVSKLVLLTLHFPTLRILWCESPYATAELFQCLKGQRQPDSTVAAAVGTDSESARHHDRLYNAAPQDFLLRLPGITFKNYRLLRRIISYLFEYVNKIQVSGVFYVYYHGHACALLSKYIKVYYCRCR
jgi:DNA excision repair protein ERCC-4